MTTGALPPEVLTDIVDLLVGCPAFAGVERGALEALAATAEIAHSDEGGDLLERTPVRPLVVQRGALIVRDAAGRTIDLVAQGEFHSPTSEERLEPVQPTMVVLLDEDAVDLAWSVSHERLRTVLLDLDRSKVDLQTAPARSVMSTRLITADPDEPCRVAAARMRDHRISSVVVFRGAEAGIMTDRDLRNRVVASGRDADTPVGEIATFPARTVDADTPVFEALVEMLATGIHHMPVTEGGRIVAMVTSSDLLQLDTRNPLQLRKALDRADSVEAVAQAVGDLPEAAHALLVAGTTGGDVGRVIATVSDRVTQRLLVLSAAELGQPPADYTWMAFGSQGRQEQTLHSDQDTGLLLPDGLGGDALAWFKRLGEWMTDALERCGYPRCPGGVMASCDGWRDDVDGWRRRFSAWIRSPSEEHLLGSEIGFDLRRVAGALDVRALLGPTIAGAAEQRLFLSHLASQAVGHRPPLGFFGDLTVSRGREHAGTFDVKASAMLPTADLARVHALAIGTPAVSTDERLEAAAAEGQLSEDLSTTLRQGYELALRIRLELHVEQWRNGAAQHNRADPDQLSRLVRSQLKESFKAIKTAQDSLEATYHTGMFG